MNDLPKERTLYWFLIPEYELWPVTRYSWREVTIQVTGTTWHSCHRPYCKGKGKVKVKRFILMNFLVSEKDRGPCTVVMMYVIWQILLVYSLCFPCSSQKVACKLLVYNFFSQANVKYWICFGISTKYYSYIEILRFDKFLS